MSKPLKNGVFKRGEAPLFIIPLPLAKGKACPPRLDRRGIKGIGFLNTLTILSLPGVIV